MKLIALGNIYLGSNKEVISGIKYNSSLQKVFNAADLLFANLEGPITNAGNEPINGVFGLYSEFGAIKFLKEYGVNLVSLSNNHIGDYGPVSVEFTIDFLNENGIRHFGWGKNLNEVLYPKTITVNGLRIGLIGITMHDGRGAEAYLPGVVPFEERFYAPLIKKTKADSDVVICSMHWGNDMYPYPDPRDRKFAHQIIDMGVDLILGHHPYVVQGYEIYNNKHIFYSLGNFVFSDYWYKGDKQIFTEESKKAIFVEFVIDKNGVKSFEVNPFLYNNDLSIENLNEKDKNEFLGYFKKISQIIISKEYKAIYHKFRAHHELQFKKRFKEILGREGISFVLFLYLINFIKKYFMIALLRR